MLPPNSYRKAKVDKVLGQLYFKTGRFQEAKSRLLLAIKNIAGRTKEVFFMLFKLHLMETKSAATEDDRSLEITEALKLQGKGKTETEDFFRRCGVPISQEGDVVYVEEVKSKIIPEISEQLVSSDEEDDIRADEGVITTKNKGNWLVNKIIHVGLQVDKNTDNARDNQIRKYRSVFGENLKIVELDIGKGLTTRSYFYENPESDRCVVVYHGAYGFVEQWFSLLHMLAVQQLNIFMLGYQERGTNLGKATEQSIHQDGMLAVEYVSRVKKFKHENIYLFGYCLGSNVALETAANQKIAVGKVLIVGAFLNASSYANEAFWVNHGKLGVPVKKLVSATVGNRFDSLAAIKRLSKDTELMIMHGENDVDSAYNNSAILYNEATTNKQLLKLTGEGSEHGNFMDNDDFKGEMKQFFAEKDSDSNISSSFIKIDWTEGLFSYEKKIFGDSVHYTFQDNKRMIFSRVVLSNVYPEPTGKNKIENLYAIMRCRWPSIECCLETCNNICVRNYGNDYRKKFRLEDEFEQCRTGKYNSFTIEELTPKEKSDFMKSASLVKEIGVYNYDLFEWNEGIRDYKKDISQDEVNYTFTSNSSDKIFKITIRKTILRKDLKILEGDGKIVKIQQARDTLTRNRGIIETYFQNINEYTQENLTFEREFAEFTEGGSDRCQVCIIKGITEEKQAVQDDPSVPMTAL